MNLVESQRNLAQQIIDYSKSQADLWRRIPYLAIRSNGLTGWSPGFEYSQGIMVVPSSKSDGYYNVTVDLETGDLTQFGKERDDIYWIRVVCSLDLDELNAQRYIDYHESHISAGLSSYMPKNTAAKIAQNLVEYPVDVFYTRKKAVNVTLFSAD